MKVHNGYRVIITCSKHREHFCDILILRLLAVFESGLKAEYPSVK